MDKKKMISVLIPTYNEEKSIEQLYIRIKAVFETEISRYDHEIVFCDNDSADNTQEIIRKICEQDQKCKAVFNVKNFGFHRNIIQAFSYASGDAAFLIFGDIQDPPEMLPAFINEWEKGSLCVVGQRKTTAEKGLKKALRGAYYNIMDILGQKKVIHDMNGFGLYDRTFINTVNSIEEISPYFKSVIEEYGGSISIVPYEQQVSKREKSNFNFWGNYDFMMYGITSSTKMLMRIATFIGVVVAILGFMLALYVFIRKIIAWDSYPIGNASTIIVILAIGGIQLLFIGVLGEYILTINERISRKPRCIAKEKLNFK